MSQKQQKQSNDDMRAQRCEGVCQICGDVKGCRDEYDPIEGQRIWVCRRCSNIIDPFEYDHGDSY